MPFPLPTYMYDYQFARPNVVSLDVPFSREGEKRVIVSMYEEEDDYFAGLQLIHGVTRNIVSFQEFHDKVYDGVFGKSRMNLTELVNNLYCSELHLVELLVDNLGDLKHNRRVKRMREADAMPRTYSIYKPIS